MSVCLDSWAALAWIDSDEPAYSRVEALLEQAPLMSWVNAVEVYDRLDRVHGRDAADDTLADLRKVITLELPGPARMIEVGRLKSARPIALGDCFAIATAAAHRIPLLTGDPEILAQSDLPCAVEDLRPHPA